MAKYTYVPTYLPTYLILYKTTFEHWCFMLVLPKCGIGRSKEPIDENLSSSIFTYVINESNSQNINFKCWSLNAACHLQPRNAAIYGPPKKGFNFKSNNKQGPSTRNKLENWKRWNKSIRTASAPRNQMFKDDDKTRLFDAVYYKQ